MHPSDSPTPADDLQRILESAHRLGVELDEAEALQWLTAMAAGEAGGDLVVDTRQGVFGHKVSMLDFSPDELDHFRRVGALVEIPDVPDQVETALALSGSAAQSRIQSHPGDCDFFERINILAPTREEACRTLARVLRDKALSARRGPTYQLIEVKFGSWPEDLVVQGRPVRKGTPISWTPADIEAGAIEAFRPDGTPRQVTWEEAAQDPGWCKLDWIIADAVHSELANASNMLDVTWEAPDGAITPLDGYLDPYFQEVYLEAEAIPLFSKLAQHVSADALDEYVAQLEKEVEKYLVHKPNYGKAAKRMYNVFRLTGRYVEAAYLRELFDEPATLLYRVWSLLRAIEDALTPGSPISRKALRAQADELVLDVVETLEGEQEREIVRRLLDLRESLSDEAEGEAWRERIQVARNEVIRVVNNFFYERLTAVPEIKTYVEGFQQAGTATPT